ncbi:hypothetical protein Hanom_Chr04g00292561 [Helianthus anomalus]
MAFLWKTSQNHSHLMRGAATLLSSHGEKTPEISSNPIKEPKTKSVNLVSNCYNNHFFFEMPYLEGNWDAAFLTG